MLCAQLCFALLAATAAAGSTAVDTQCHLGSPCEFSVSEEHFFARRKDGSVLSWGESASGQLGLGCSIGKSHKVVAPTVVAGASDVVELVAGLAHVIARRKDGKLLAWGNNYYGQLGFGDIMNRCTPAVIHNPAFKKGFEVVQVVAGSRHTLVRRKDGLVLGWGWNHYGQLGVGDVAARHEPTMIFGASNVAQLVASGVFTLARRKDGTVLAWGDNGFAQLGLGHSEPAPVTKPTVVPGATHVIQLVAGTFHAIALREDGTVMAWGDNGYGQLGLGTHRAVTTPTVVPGLSGVVEVAAGGVHTLARHKNGTVLAWGSNFYGQLGLPDTTPGRAAPTAVPGATDVGQLVAGNRHTIVKRRDGTAMAWGDNHGYELISALGQITKLH